MAKILVVEDTPELRSYIVGIFKDQYQVLEAPNGKVGLELALNNTPNLIISDVMMPVMDGIELCKQLKKNDIRLLDSYYCPFHPDHGEGDYKKDSNDRKPKPG